MGKQRYLGHWTVDQSRIPVDPVERGNLFLLMVYMVKAGYEVGENQGVGLGLLVSAMVFSWPKDLRWRSA